MVQELTGNFRPTVRDAAILPVAQAAARFDVVTDDLRVRLLDRTGLGHLLVIDPGTGRGQLIYRRFDTCYALLKDTR